MRRWGSGRWVNKQWDIGIIGQWTIVQRDNETMGNVESDTGPWGNGQWDHGNGRTGKGDNARWDNV
jgi:hypothetical protein